jgi:hypothetical protein
VRKSGYASGIGIDQVYPFATVAFASWNFSIETQELSKNQQDAISTVLKTLISKKELAGKIVPLSTSQKIKLFLRRLLANLLSFVVLGGTGFIIFDSVQSCRSTTNRFMFNLQSIFTKTSKSYDHCDTSNDTPFSPYLVSVFNLVLPPVFNALARFEQYADPQWELRATLARSYLIKVASIYLMLYSMFSAVSCCAIEFVVCLMLLWQLILLA